MSEDGHPNVPNSTFPQYNEIATKFVHGVAPKANLIPCRVTGCVALFSQEEANLAKAIFYAISLSKNLSVGVISISLGSVWFTEHKALKTAIQEAKKEGIIICAAGGQLSDIFGDFNKLISVRYPGSSPDTIGVAACDYQDKMLSYGFYGPGINITAPGINVWKAESYLDSITANPSYKVDQGTGSSYATAITAGACALWQAYHGRANLISKYKKVNLFDLFRLALGESCRKPQGWQTAQHGKGVLDVEALLKYTLPPNESALKTKLNQLGYSTP
jgi:serine protease